MPKLTKKQVTDIRREMEETGTIIPTANNTPARFLYRGQNLNIVTGTLLPRGCNVMYHVVYWNFTKDMARHIAKMLGVTVVFG